MFCKMYVKLLCFIVLFVHAQDEVEQIPIGNFALPSAQQPGPLFAFGQNILDKHDVVGIEGISFLKGHKRKFITNILSVIYGVTDDFSFSLSVPAPVINKENNFVSAGFGDVVLQGEYALARWNTPTSATMATIVGSIFLPTGILQRKGIDLSPRAPFTGLGATSFFLGTTINTTTIDWYRFGSIGGIITTEKLQTKLGNTLFYQWGIGRNIQHLDEQILFCLLEFNGIFTKQDKILGVLDPNSGGNTIYCGPILYYATPRTYIEIGVQAPIVQHLRGNQIKNSFILLFSFEYFFNHDEYDRPWLT